MTMVGFTVQVGPKVNSMTVVPGKFYTTSYIAKNNTDETIINMLALYSCSLSSFFSIF
jgi:cytochrome c oxidase assembly protein subunit 11